MPESAQTSGPSGPSLEQILWRAVDRWEERPSLIDVEEFADHIAGVFDGELPAEAFIERFFEGVEKLHHAPADMAEAVVRATRNRLSVQEFDLRRLEYVIVEDEKQVVVVSQFGQFALANDDQVGRALQAAVLPQQKVDRGGSDPKGWLVRRGGETVALDVKKVAASLHQFMVRQISSPAVERPAQRLLPFNPVKRSLSEAREERALRQDPRMRQALPIPGRLLKPESNAPAPKGPPAGAQTALFIVLPGGELARATIGAANRWREMLGGRGGTEVTGGQRIAIQAGNVVAIVSRSGQHLGESALGRSEALAAVRTGAEPVRVLGDRALEKALAAGAQLVPGLAQGDRFWVQPEKALRPEQEKKPAAQALRLGEITGDPWADWALTGGGAMPAGAMLALRGRTRHALLAALDRLQDQGEMALPPELVGRMRAARGPLDLAGSPVVGFRALDGSVIVPRRDGPIRLAAMDRLGDALLPIDLRAEIAPRSGAVPASALAALQMALERTASAGGYRLPIGRLDSAFDALEAGSGLQLDAGDPRRFSVRLAGPPSLSGQTAQLLLSMPFPNQGEIHVGDDLAQALSAYLAAPVMPAYPAGRGMSAAAVPDSGGGGVVLRLRPGQDLGSDALDWAELHLGAAQRAQDAVVTLDLPAVQPLMAGSSTVSDLPFLLRHALAGGQDWVPGPGAPMPLAIRAFALRGPFDQFSPGELALPETGYRPPRPGEEEIVIPMPLWAQMGRGRISETDQIMASPFAPNGYQPPIGIYRLVAPGGAPFDLTGGAPVGTPGMVELSGPLGLELMVTNSGGVAASSLGGRQMLGRVPLDDGETVVTSAGRIRSGRATGIDTLVASPAAAGAPQASALPMAGALSSALGISDELGSRTSPPRPANAGNAAAAPALQSDNAAFAARAETAGRSLAGAAPSFAAGSGEAALVTAGLSGGRLGSSMTDARSAASDAASSSAAVRSTPAFVTGLPPGMWSGHDRRSTADYQTWSYRRIPEQPQTAGGIDLGLLSRPVYPSLPTALRFRYVGAPLWWSNGRSGAEDSTPAGRALRAGLSAATSAASIWRSILVASPAWGGFDADDLSGGMDSGVDASALGMSSLSRSFDALSATLAAGGGVAAGRAAPAGDAAFIATTRSGQAGAIGSAAATRAARASSVEMSIVAAIPRSPPPLESMGASAASGAEQPHARGKGHAHGQDKEHVEAVSHSKIEGSVDAIAQRIYHRIRRRIESDRERFGG